MKLELFLLLFLLYFGLENSNKRIIRKLDESDDTDSDIVYSSEPSSEEEKNPSDSTYKNSTKESKLFLIGFGNYSRSENGTFLNFIIFFKKYKIFHDLPENITITVEIKYLRRLRFLKERNVNCSKITKEEDENNTQYNCIVKEIDPYQTISKLSIKYSNRF